MGLFGTITGLIGASKQKKASRAAEAAMVDALNKGMARLDTNLADTKSLLSPVTETLDPTMGALGDLLGINGSQGQQTAIDGLRTSPLYQSLFRNGQEAVLQNAAATGGIRGGNTQRGLADFGADTLASTIQQQLGNLSGLAQIGLGGAGTIANVGTGTATNIAELLNQIGQAKAGGALTRGGINAGMWNSAGSFLDKTAGAGNIGGQIKTAIGKIF